MATVRHLGLFPFCLPLSNPVTDPEFQWVNESLNGDIASSLAFYWRVKKLRVSISASVRLFYPDIFDLQDSGSGYADIYRQDINTETDLVCKTIGEESYAIQTDGSIEAGFFDPLYSWKPEWFNSEMESVNFRGIFSISWIPSVEGLEREFATVALGYPSNFFNPAPTIFDPDYKIELLPANNLILTTTKTTSPKSQTDGVGIVRETAITSFKVEVTEWWGYDPEDGGGPIYDTSTGARIRDDV